MLNVEAGSQLGPKVCSFPLSHPTDFDYSLFLCSLCDKLNKLNYLFSRSDYITHLVYPLETVLDDSIGCALWFAARGEGTLRCPECVDMASEGISGTCSHPAKYTCQAKVCHRFHRTVFSSLLKHPTIRVDGILLGGEDTKVSSWNIYT